MKYHSDIFLTLLIEKDYTLFSFSYQIQQTIISRGNSVTLLFTLETMTSLMFTSSSSLKTHSGTPMSDFSSNSFLSRSFTELFPEETSKTSSDLASSRCYFAGRIGWTF